MTDLFREAVRTIVKTFNFSGFYWNSCRALGTNNNSLSQDSSKALKNYVSSEQTYYITGKISSFLSARSRPSYLPFLICRAVQINTRAFVYFLHNVMSNCDLHVDYGDIGKFFDTQLPHKLVKFWEEFSSISHIGPHQVTSFCCPATYILTLRPLPHSSACSAGGYFHSKQYPQVHMQCMLWGDI